MIIIRKTLDKDLKKLYSFINENNIMCSNSKVNFEHRLILIDGKDILGFLSLDVYSNEFAVINVIFIQENMRNKGLGEGLLRASINYTDQMKMQYVLIKTDERIQNFVQKSGLLPLSSNILSGNISQYIEQYKFEKFYYCEPKVFFSRGCKAFSG